MLAFLCGAMEFAPDGGRDWREKMRRWLEENVNHAAYDPTVEARRLMSEGDLRCLPGWKTTDLERFRKAMRFIINHDLDVMRSRADYVVCYWDAAAARGGGGDTPPHATATTGEGQVSIVQATSAADAADAPARSRRRGGGSRLARRRRRAGILLSLPAVIVVVALLGIPIGQAIYYSMTTWDGISSTWIGPSTYTTALSDPILWRVLQNNALLLLSVPFAIGVPLGIAALLHEHVRGWRFFRSVYFLPTAISWVVIGMVAVQFFALSGLMNAMLRAAGLASLQTDMLAGQRSALVALAITFVWSMLGTNTIIFLTGMATLDPTLIEAARVDGLTRRQIFFRVTVPLLKRFIQFSFVITVISAFSALFSLIFVMTNGGPGFGTTTLEFFVYQSAFAQGQFGTGALYGIILFVIMIIAGLVQLRLIRSEDGEGW